MKTNLDLGSLIAIAEECVLKAEATVTEVVETEQARNELVRLVQRTAAAKAELQKQKEHIFEMLVRCLMLCGKNQFSVWNINLYFEADAPSPQVFQSLSFTTGKMPRDAKLRSIADVISTVERATSNGFERYCGLMMDDIRRFAEEMGTDGTKTSAVSKKLVEFTAALTKCAAPIS